MGLQNYISESEARTVTGMSGATLGRFAEAGYLQVETDADGLRFFLREELERIFGIKTSTPIARPSGNPKSEFASSSTQVSATPAAAPDNASAQSISFSSISSASASNIEAPPPPAHESEVMPRSPSQNFWEMEISRLKHLVELQEKILDLKDKEVQDLRSQRDWLKARIERAEDKNDRDQVLLLSETQTIRSLLNMQQKKASPVRLALEWLGFADPKPSPETSSNRANAIEVDKAA